MRPVGRSLPTPGLEQHFILPLRLIFLFYFLWFARKTKNVVKIECFASNSGRFDQKRVKS